MTKIDELEIIYDYNFEFFILNSDYDREKLQKFSCGNAEINYYLQEHAIINNSCGNGTTYIVVDITRNTLVAYYTLNTYSLLYKEEDKTCGLPSIEIKIFSVNKSYQDKTIICPNGNKVLISDFLFGSLLGKLYVLSSDVVGFKAIFLYSTLDAVNFYKRNSFCELDKYIATYDKFAEECIPMYLPLFDLEPLY